MHPLIGTTQAQSAFGQGDVAEGIVCFYTAKEPGTVGHTVVVGGGGFSVALVLLLVAGVLVTDVGGELQSALPVVAYFPFHTFHVDGRDVGILHRAFFLGNAGLNVVVYLAEKSAHLVIECMSIARVPCAE